MLRFHHPVLGMFGRTPALAALWLIAGIAAATAQTGSLWSRCATGTRPAVAACTEIIKSGRETPRNTAIAHYNLGVAYRASGDHARAISSFDDAIGLNPNYAAAFTARGTAYMVMRQETRAQADFRSAIRIVEAKGTARSSEEQEAERIARIYLGAPAPSPSTKSPQAAEIPLPPAFDLPPITKESFAAPRPATPSPTPSPAPLTKSIGAPNPPAIDLPPPPVFDLPQITADSLTPRPAPSPPAVVAVAPTPSAPLPAPLAAPRLDGGRRVALVIGNSAYQQVARLPNPARDAETVAAALRASGFAHVALERNLTREKILDTLRAFSAEADRADWAVIYFAGHGLEMNGTNYLIPVEAKLATDRDVDYEAVALDKVVNAVEGAKRLRLVLLDACRDNPFVRGMRRSVATRSIGRGLAQLEPEAGTLVVYAAKHGQVALDGDEGNSPFVTALVNRMKTPGLEVRRLFDLVRDDVMTATNRKQQPFSYGSVSGSEDFYFLAGR